jgi:hypothetical protein
MKFKKLFSGIMVLVALTAFLVVPAGAKDRVNWTVDNLTVLKTAKIQGLLQTAANTTGNVFYVNSATGADAVGVAGSNSNQPFDSVDYAIGRCTANNGDVIIVMPGHAESFTAADGFDADVAGITIIGLGSGTDMPEFTFAATDATVAVGAANVTFVNLRFIAGISNIAAGIVIEAAGDNFTMIGCEVPEPGTATFEFATFIDAASGADNIIIDGMDYRHLAITPGDADHFIELGAGINKGVRIINSDIRGEFLVAAIWSDKADTHVLIDNSIIVNATNGQHAIEFTGAATGLIRNTSVSTDAQATAVDPGSLDLVNVKWNSDTTPDVAGIDVIATALGASGADSIGSINATTTDSIHGKIGTDTEMADSSLYDMLTAAAFGTVNATTTDGLHGKIGTDTEMADSSLYDFIIAQPRSVVTSAVAVPDNTTTDLFTISGGPVRCKIVGVVTTVLGGNANGKVQMTTTTPAATLDLSAAAVATNDDAAGTVYHHLGATAVFTPGGELGIAVLDPVTVEETEFILTPGTVKYHSSATQTGAITWYMTYTPMSPLSRVVAAQ